jgi:hypothetical protein
VSDPRTHTSSVPACTMLVTVTHLGTALVTLVLLTTALFVLAGTLLDTMGFEFKGMVGLLLKDQKDVNYSLTTVGTSIPYHSGTPHSFAVRWMQASFFLFGQAMPLATLLACALLWLVPLTLQQQRSLMVLAEVCNAWSALDVFCIAIAAALLEIQQFVIFIVGDSCDAINVLLAEYLDPLLGGDDVCFDVVATLGEVSAASVSVCYRLSPMPLTFPSLLPPLPLSELLGDIRGSGSADRGGAAPAGHHQRLSEDAPQPLCAGGGAAHAHVPGHCFAFDEGAAAIHIQRGPLQRWKEQQHQPQRG